MKINHKKEINKKIENNCLAKSKHDIMRTFTMKVGMGFVGIFWMYIYIMHLTERLVNQQRVEQSKYFICIYKQNLQSQTCLFF